MPPENIPLENASNLRDLGGWPTTDGRRVRQGLVYRGAALFNLSPQDQQTIAALGLRATADLRGTAERDRHPVLIPGATAFSLAIEPSVGAELTDILRTGRASPGATAETLMQVLTEAYRAFALRNARQFGAFFHLLLDEERLPLLLHCTAGKDRTGFGSALLLSALGVTSDHVKEDYLATNRFWRRETMRGVSLPDDMTDVLLLAPAPLLDAAFAAIDAEYGSLDAYLAGPIGLSAGGLRTLRHRLLEH